MNDKSFWGDLFFTFFWIFTEFCGMEACWCFVCVGCFLAFVSAYAACTFVVEVEVAVVGLFGFSEWSMYFNLRCVAQFGVCGFQRCCSGKLVRDNS